MIDVDEVPVGVTVIGMDTAERPLLVGGVSVSVPVAGLNTLEMMTPLNMFVAPRFTSESRSCPVL